ncbi:MAG TPA: primosomal protein N', partial [Bacteriovoracaceae bacterium]|nr:primosomal protein N' [Bacteriovoracaceae bacterium]
LRKRAGGAYLPSIELVDARDKNTGEDDIWPLTERSVLAIKEAVERDEQILVFVNRLGFASYIQCRSCGEQFNCPNCSVSLRFFKRKNELQCQHCDYKEPMVQSCQSCGCMTLMQKGFGTEKIAEVLDNIFPHKKIERFDRDEIKTFTQLQQRLDDFHQGRINIMVGTQMLSKGHNFEKVKLVLILGIDNQLNFPDFRSSERVYQTLTQVAGRAGRYSQDGRVMIQTLNPENPLFETVKEHSFDGFYNSELGMREICQCPPFQKIALIHFTSRFADRVISHAQRQGEIMRHMIEHHFPAVIILGPRQAMIEKKVNQFSWSILLKTQEPAQLHNLIKSFEMNYQNENSVSYKVDIDPYSLF